MEKCMFATTALRYKVVSVKERDVRLRAIARTDFVMRVQDL